LGGPISRDFIERVRDSVDAVRVIADYVTLKPAGSRLKGLCPFHQEKTPSFTVDPDRKLFFCFGCQAGGDLFKFVMMYENVDFSEAVKSLARRFNIPIPASGPRADGPSPRDRVLAMNEVADAFFRELLEQDAGKECRGYLERRGLTAETVERLGLGYSAPGWESLRTHLSAKRFSAPEMVRAGLAVESKSGGQPYDRFRDRLIFPIHDVTGRTVAFGGRAISDEGTPKYLNSPETPAYVKGEHLYGLDLARGAIRREGYAVVVEGYLDLAAVLQAGFENAVASLGTAFTPAQARLLGRYTQRVVFSYDGDAAGSAAAVRTVDLLLESGFEVRVVGLPEGMDPDDYIKEKGAEAYGRLVRQAPGYLEFIVEKEARARDLTRVEDKVAAVNAVLPHLAKLSSSIERAEWAGRLADALGVEDGLVQQELRAALRAGRAGIRRVPERSGGPRPAEAKLVALLLQFEDCRREAEESLESEDLEGSQVSNIVATLLRLSRDGAPVAHDALFDALTDETDRNLLTRIAFSDEPTGRPQDLEDCVRVLRKERLVRERRNLRQDIEKTADAAALDSLLARKQRLDQQIDALS
jgi:DNA primase